jgi:S-methylmethionine-dependent homocysteine/selenocysteine methylase
MLLRKIWDDYINVAEKYSLPMLILTPTWRANRDNLAGDERFDGINESAVSFLADIRGCRNCPDDVLIGGLMGPRGDAYNPSEALDAGAAEKFHLWQGARLAEAGADFLIASTLPALSEALGLANAMAAAGLEYIISFVVLKNGRLPDGNKLSDAVERIDSQASRPPIAYMINCVHPDNARLALENNPAGIRSRIAGLQANASPLQPSELDNAERLHSSDPAQWAASMLQLRDEYGINILGGCCGTDPEFIEMLAAAFKS